jgi:cytochrome c553
MRRLLFLITTPIVVASGLLAPVAGAADDDQRVAVCAGCHGPAGHSNVADNPILAGQSADYLKSALTGYLDGSRDYGIMKTLAGRLSAGDIDAIAGYYAAQPPAKSQAKVAIGDAQRGSQKVAACAACHGAEGNSALPLYPNLAGQHAKYLRKALLAYKSGTRSHAVMMAMAAVLNEQDIADVAAFYASQPVTRNNATTAPGGN